jgi:hypothetical protein
LRRAAELAGTIALKIPIKAEIVSASIKTIGGICIGNPPSEGTVDENTLSTRYAAPHPSTPPSRLIASEFHWFTLMIGSTL